MAPRDAAGCLLCFLLASTLATSVAAESESVCEGATCEAGKPAAGRALLQSHSKLVNKDGVARGEVGGGGEKTEADSNSSNSAEGGDLQSEQQSENKATAVEASTEQQRTMAAAKAQREYKEFAAHRGAVRRAVDAANETYGPTNEELDNLITHFIDHKAASQDKCPSLLLEAKHQWNALHVHLHELAVEFNSTEMSIQAVNYELTQLYYELNQTVY